MKNNMGRSVSRCLGVVSLSIATVLMSGCDSKSDTDDQQLRPVRYMTIETPVESRTQTLTGSSKSAQESRLSFKVAGTVVKIPVQVGDKIEAGGLVARLDPSQYELRVEQSQATLLEAQANARNAQANYERIKELYENNNASRNDLDSARASAESAEAQVRASYKSLELARLDLSYTRLRVENDCSIGELFVEINENVNAGTRIAQVNCGEELEVLIEVPEGIIADISQQMPVDVRFDALAEKVFKGRVFEIGVSSSQTSATFPVSISLDSTDQELRSGLAAEVTFTFLLKSGPATYLVPLSSVINDMDGVFVFIADPDEQTGEGLVRRKAVRLGELTDEGMQVLEGIEQGDRVITAGITVIRDGQRVLLP